MKMNKNEVRKEMAEENMREVKELEETYKGIGSLMQALGYEIFDVIETYHGDMSLEMFDKMVRIERMFNILNNRMIKEEGSKIDRSTLDYLFSNLEETLKCFTIDSLCTGDDKKKVYSRDDVHCRVREVLEESKYLY